MLLFQITAPNFCAGLILSDKDVCVDAAPILKWAVGKHRHFLRRYFGSRGWVATYCEALKNGLQTPRESTQTQSESAGRSDVAADQNRGATILPQTAGAHTPMNS